MPQPGARPEGQDAGTQHEGQASVFGLAGGRKRLPVLRWWVSGACMQRRRQRWRRCGGALLARALARSGAQHCAGTERWWQPQQWALLPPRTPLHCSPLPPAPPFVLKLRRAGRLAWV